MVEDVLKFVKPRTIALLTSEASESVQHGPEAFATFAIGLPDLGLALAGMFGFAIWLVDITMPHRQCEEDLVGELDEDTQLFRQLFETCAEVLLELTGDVIRECLFVDCTILDSPRDG